MVSHIRMELLQILGRMKFVPSNGTSASSLPPYGSSFQNWKKKCHLPLQFDHPPAVLRRRIVIRRRNRAWIALKNSLKEHMVFPFMNSRFKSINSCEEMISQNYSRPSQYGDRSSVIDLEGRSPEVEAL